MPELAFPFDGTVGVVVPLYNSENTIDETLRSIASQTYRNLDIVVVDDGSNDMGSAIVEKWHVLDSRIRLIRQANAGVAAARNAGAAAVRSNVIGFCDADDLWSPRKVELQLKELALSGRRSEFVYCWFAVINEDSRVTSLVYRPTDQGEVLRQLFRHCFVGNASSLLVTRALFDRAGGFDSSLRAADCQGCEDYSFFLRAAELTEYSLVPEFLVGYRQIRGSLSDDVTRMRRSHARVVGEFEKKYPAHASDIQWGLADFTLFLTHRALRNRRYGTAASLLGDIDAGTKRRRKHYLIDGLLRGLFLPRSVVQAVRRFTLPTFEEFTRQAS